MEGSTSLQSFLEQLQSLGIYGGFGQGGQSYGMAQDFGGLLDLSGEDIGSQLAKQMGVSQQYLQPGMFTSLSEDLLKGAQIGSYSPQIQTAQSDLLSRLSQGMQGSKVKKAYGKGFAGTGAKDVYGRQLKSEYGQGMTKELSQVYAQQSQSEAGLGSWLQQQFDVLRDLQGSAA